MLQNVHLFSRESIPPLIRVREVAKLLAVSRHTVHALIQSGDLEARDINPSRPRVKRRNSRRHVRVTRISLLMFYKKRFGRPLAQALANPFAMAA